MKPKPGAQEGYAESGEERDDPAYPPPTSGCVECSLRKQLLAASEQLLAEKRHEYRYHTTPAYARLMGRWLHQAEQARANLERHRAEHERAGQ